MTDEMIVKNNEAAHRYEVDMDGHVAVLTYMKRGRRIIFLHTGVPHELEGHGIGNKLAQFALNEARAQNLAVIPECPFVAAYIRRHQEYLPLVPQEEQRSLLEN